MAKTASADDAAAVLRRAGRRLLYELDKAMCGEESEFIGGTLIPGYKLSAEQYADAQRALLNLWEIVSEAKLVPSPIGQARADDRFQAFLDTATTKPKRRRERATGSRP